ncbi:MAG: N-acetyltransferase [Methanobrevibacter sp.]|nr:N-acetyltransferase [Methanobrevibacter sp.]
MDIEYIKENYYFEILNEKHDLSNFECDSNDLTNFLKNDALKQQDMNLNLTQLVICDNEIVGFFSLLTDTLKLKTLENNNLKKEIKLELDISENNEIPAIKIGRLAIDKKYSKKGLGSHILRNILLSILNLSKTKVGLRFVTVDAYATSLNFYVKKNNFSSRKSDTETLKKIDKIKKQNPNRSFILYLDLKDINCSKD